MPPEGERVVTTAWPPTPRHPADHSVGGSTPPAGAVGRTTRDTPESVLWLFALPRWEAERAEAWRLLAMLQTRAAKQFPNRERWVRQATILGEWKLRAPRTWTPGPEGGVWRPRLVLAA